MSLTDSIDDLKPANGIIWVKHTFAPARSPPQYGIAYLEKDNRTSWTLQNLSFEELLDKMGSAIAKTPNSVFRNYEFSEMFPAQIRPEVWCQRGLSDSEMDSLATRLSYRSID